MYSNNYKNINANDISLRPSWLGIVDLSKGCISIKKNNEIISNDYINIDNDISNDISNDYNVNDTGNNENIKFGTLNFEYYSERAEFIKKNAVFLKPQYQNVETLEQYLKLLNKNKDVYADENTIDNDINDFTVQKKKTKFSKYSLYSILLSPGKNLSVENNDTTMDHTNENNYNYNNITKKKLLKYKKNENENYDSDASEHNDDILVPEYDEINVKRR